MIMTATGDLSKVIKKNSLAPKDVARMIVDVYRDGDMNLKSKWTSDDIDVIIEGTRKHYQARVARAFGKTGLWGTILMLQTFAEKQLLEALFSLQMCLSGFRIHLDERFMNAANHFWLYDTEDELFGNRTLFTKMLEDGKAGIGIAFLFRETLNVIGSKVERDNLGDDVLRRPLRKLQMVEQQLVHSRPQELGLTEEERKTRVLKAYGDEYDDRFYPMLAAEAFFEHPDLFRDYFPSSQVEPYEEKLDKVRDYVAELSLITDLDGGKVAKMIGLAS